MLDKSAKTALRLSAGFSRDRVQPASKHISVWRIRRGRRNVKCFSVEIAECACRDISNRHLDYAINLSVWCCAHYTSAKEAAVPQITVDIYRRAVRQAAWEILKK
jgi:hypothetical protein